MSTFSEQISSNKAAIRFDVVGGPERTAVAEDMSFLNYRLGSVEVSHEITKEQPDIIWYYDEAVKSIRYENEQLILTSFWEEGELNKIMVTMLANQMDKEGLHPFHSSSVVYRGHGILLVGGENNHGKSMTQLEGCRRVPPSSPRRPRSWTTRPASPCTAPRTSTSASGPRAPSVLTWRTRTRA